MSGDPVTVQLVEEDRRQLRRSVLNQKTGGFQTLLHDLRRIWEADGCRKTLAIPRHYHATIHRYAVDYGDGGWQSMLRRWAAQLPAPAAVHQQGDLL